MEFINQTQQHFGLMAWPLMICSLLTLIIITERLIHVIANLHSGRKEISSLLANANSSNPTDIQMVIDAISEQKALVFQATSLLLRQSHIEKNLREDLLGIWLQEKRHQLQSGLKVLSLIGVISPLLGLLGTVLGLIEMFKGVAMSSGNITPNDLADGLGLAMKTTAAGLIIALPAIVGAQLFTLWSERLLAKLEHSLNRTNLWLSGVHDSPSNKHSNQSTKNNTTLNQQVFE
ncbi:MotA/TolQ/ExbB proton channel family protein [Vibrio rumoiensis]|uniref:Biopolymer transporter ExbB n=1 Tax=Vibrio rumoiensis 1S-45 TaxID=1188252 RepID=A0A1E5E4B6_9VIBR|nr:MotA/TolQ/ExbB proton channel family protein [Vibrio rumoiensis]OEF27608.1 biopolymer transporter ExbB [Vibrio rumoiensis 1S-45]